MQLKRTLRLELYIFIFWIIRSFGCQTVNNAADNLGDKSLLNQPKGKENEDYSSSLDRVSEEDLNQLMKAFSWLILRHQRKGQGCGEDMPTKLISRLPVRGSDCECVWATTRQDNRTTQWQRGTHMDVCMQGHPRPHPHPHPQRMPANILDNMAIQCKQCPRSPLPFGHVNQLMKLSTRHNSRDMGKWKRKVDWVQCWPLYRPAFHFSLVLKPKPTIPRMTSNRLRLAVATTYRYIEIGSIMCCKLDRKTIF